MKKIFIYTNNTEMSRSIEKTFRQKLVKSGLTACSEYSDDTDLIICIGGDGTLLRLVQDFGFPKTPIVGINTGHLGFFQEILPEKIDDFIFLYNQGRYSIQGLNGVSCVVRTASHITKHIALNEITVKGMLTHPVHLNISINNGFIERFSGIQLRLRRQYRRSEVKLASGDAHSPDPEHCLPFSDSRDIAPCQ